MDNIILREQLSKVAKRMDVLGFPESIDLLGRHKLESAFAIATGHAVEALIPLLTLCESMLQVGPIYTVEQQVSIGCDLVLVLLAKIAEDWKKGHAGLPNIALEQLVDSWVRAKQDITEE